MKMQLFSELFLEALRGGVDPLHDFLIENPSYVPICEIYVAEQFCDMTIQSMCDEACRHPSNGTEPEDFDFARLIRVKMERILAAMEKNIRDIPVRLYTEDYDRRNERYSKRHIYANEWVSFGDIFDNQSHFNCCDVGNDNGMVVPVSFLRHPRADDCYVS